MMSNISAVVTILYMRKLSWVNNVGELDLGDVELYQTVVSNKGIDRDHGKLDWRLSITTSLIA